MTLLLILQLIGILPFLPVAPMASADPHDAYIRTFRQVAIQEMERTGIPASIKLAQAILESNGGRSELATKAHNHFSIKCGSNWKGPTYELKDDDYDDAGNHINSCFRVYRKDEASFIAHSEFLRDPNKASRYGFLFRIPPTDYRRWAHGLHKAGYATNPRYPQLLIDMIERYHLDQYDLVSPDALDKLAGITRINDVKLTFAREKETLATIAARTEVSVNQLLKYNDYVYTPDTPLNEDDLVYLQPKRSYFRGKQSWHKVQPGESLLSIAQLYGIRVDKLRKKNRIPDGFEPATGERIRLRWKIRKSDTPRTVRQGPVPEKVPIPDPPKQTLPKEPARPAPSVVVDDDLPDSSRPRTEPVNIAVPSVEDDPGRPTRATWHTVAPGDTLWRIAKQYDLTVEKLKSINRLTSDQIGVGQKLRVK